MFDFEKLDVYQKAKTFNSQVYNFIQSNKNLDPTTKNQLRRALFSIALNIAKGSCKFSKPDQRNYLSAARGSVFECAAVLDILHDTEITSNESFKSYLNKTDELSRILYANIKNLS